MDPLEPDRYSSAGLEGAFGDGAWANAWWPSWESVQSRRSSLRPPTPGTLLAPDELTGYGPDASHAAREGDVVSKE